MTTRPARPASRPTRIFHVITGINTGGAEMALCRLLESTRGEDAESSVVVLGGEGSLSARVSASGAKISHLGMTSYRGAPRVVPVLRRLILHAAPDVVHGWMYHANLAVTASTTLSGIPTVWGIRHSLHDLSKDKRATRLVIRLGAQLSRFPKAILYNSRVSASQHEEMGYCRPKTLVIPNGFDTKEFRPDEGRRESIRRELGIGERDLTVGMIARTHPVKDHATFLRAAATLAQSVPDVVFVLVGDGACRENQDLAELIEHLGLQRTVRLCGRRDDIPAVNAALDIACSSSAGEAFPNAIAEAMACGVPCVSTNVGEAAAIIGDFGRLVPPKDPEAFGAALASLAQIGASGLKVMGRSARLRIVDNYSMARMADRHVELYRSLGKR
jgi:glycosyltransferase involved in cell wall biosynthesis